MKHHDMGSLIIGLAAFVLTISIYFFIMKSFLDMYDSSESKFVFKENGNAVIQRYVWDPVSRSSHVENRQMYGGKEGPVINLEVIPANQYLSKEEVDTKSVTHLGK